MNSAGEKTMTTIDTITADQCWTLRDEAGIAGDERMVRIAEKAANLLEGGYDRNESAVLTCLYAIRDAEAMR